MVTYWFPKPMVSKMKKKKKLPTVKFKLISFAEGVEHLQGKKIVPAPAEFSYIFTPEPPCLWSHYKIEKNITFFDDGSAMTTVSDWEYGYYDEIDANSPLFYLGKLENV